MSFKINKKPSDENRYLIKNFKKAEDKNGNMVEILDNIEDRSIEELELQKQRLQDKMDNIAAKLKEINKIK